jgi:hypothetical protein
LNRSSVLSPNKGAAEPLISGLSAAQKYERGIVPSKEVSSELRRNGEGVRISSPERDLAPTVDAGQQAEAPVGASSLRCPHCGCKGVLARFGIAAMKARLAAGHLYKQIAYELGVSENAVGLWCREKGIGPSRWGRK